MNKVVTIGVVVLLATLALSAYAYTVYLPGLSNSSSSTGGSSGTSSGTNSGSTSLGGPGSSTLNIYLTDKPSNNSIKYLLINVTSITLRYGANETSSTTTTSATSSSATSTSTSSSSTSSVATSSTGTESSFSGHFTYNVSSSSGTNVNITSLQGNSILLGTTKIPAGNVTGIVFNITGARAYYTDGTWKQLRVVADGKLMIPVHFTVMSNGSTDLTIDITPNSIHTSQGQADILTPVIHVTVVTKVSTSTTTISALTSITTTGTYTSQSSSNSTSTTTTGNSSSTTSTATSMTTSSSGSTT